MSEDEKVGSSDSRVASASIATDGTALGYTTTPHRLQSLQKTNTTQQLGPLGNHNALFVSWLSLSFLVGNDLAQR